MKQIVLLFILGLLLSSCTGNRTTESSIILGDTITTQSGLKYIYTKIGEGRVVETGCKVSTYLALSVDGKEVWNTNDEPDSAFVFVANKDRMISGFTEVTMKLREGDEIVAILPPGLAYKEAGSPPVIPPNATLIYTKYKMIKVNEPKASMSDTLFMAYKEGGHGKMIATHQQLMNSADTAGYYYGNNEWRNLWNLLTDAKMSNEALQMIDYAMGNKVTGLRLARVRTYDQLGQTKLAFDSLSALLKSDTSYNSNPRATQLMKDLTEKLKAETK